MKPEMKVFTLIGAGERAACALAGLACAAASIGALLLGFGAASPQLWLVPTPDLSASLARCDAEVSPPAQTQCKKQVEAMSRGQSQPPQRLARQ
jgi:hypothetical protein